MNDGYSWRIPILFFLILLVGCGQSSGIERNKKQSASVVTVRNDGRTLEFPDAPDRVVTLNQSAFEMLVALGLEDKIVGKAFLNVPVLPRFRDEAKNIPTLAEQYPSLEVLLETNPDFVYGFRTAFSPPKGPATISRLEELGITAYVDLMFRQDGITLDDVHKEIKRLGRIFRVRARANKIVKSHKDRIKTVTKSLPEREEPIRVAVYDSGKQSMYTAGPSLLTDMIETVGGTNVFAGRLEDPWANVSWEAVVSSRPDVFVVMDYGDVSAETKIKRLKQNSALADVPAVKNDRFVVMPLVESFVGVRNPRGIERLAQGFYPERFEEHRQLSGEK